MSYLQSIPGHKDNCKYCRNTICYGPRKDGERMYPDGIIFIHHRKCAGVSMRTALDLKRTHDHHQPLWEAKMRVKNPEKYEKAFKFTFVRNPWDRWVSLYRFRFKIRRTMVMHEDLRHYDNLQTFRDYTKIMAEQRRDLLGVKWCLPPSYWSKLTLTPEDTPDDNMDFIGTFENVQTDWAELCTQLGIPQLIEKLPYVNPTPGSSSIDYTNYYDDETREIIGRIYRKDIEYFNYGFGE